jgi:hypothetical protein
MHPEHRIAFHTKKFFQLPLDTGVMPGISNRDWPIRRCASFRWMTPFFLRKKNRRAFYRCRSDGT